MSSSPYLPPDSLVAGAVVSGMAAYHKLVAEADADHSGYWSRLAREFVSWKTPFTKGLDDSQAPFFKWFEDGTLNVSHNCLDRQVDGRDTSAPDRRRRAADQHRQNRRIPLRRRYSRWAHSLDDLGPTIPALSAP